MHNQLIRHENGLQISNGVFESSILIKPNRITLSTSLFAQEAVFVILNRGKLSDDLLLDFERAEVEF